MILLLENLNSNGVKDFIIVINSVFIFAFLSSSVFTIIVLLIFNISIQKQTC